MKRLIVNADDFGMTGGVNRAIIAAHTEGIVTSATLMATGEALEEAVVLARGHPRLGIGCHVVLVQGQPVLAPDQVPSLTSARADGAWLRSGFAGFAGAAMLGRLHPQEIIAEVKAQIHKLQALGLQLSHLDTHKHVHLLPAVLDALLSAARECGIRAVRNPFEEDAGVKTKEFFQDRRLCARAPVFRGLHLLKMRFLRMVREHGMFTPDGALGITLTGSLNERRLERLLRRLPEGTWELVCHPAYRDEQLRRLSKLRTGEEEIAALTSPRIRQCLQESGIQLTSYAALLQPAGAAGGEAGG